LEDKMVDPIQKNSAQFTMEMVETWKTLCLTFQERFGKPSLEDWKEEQETEDVQARGRFWIRNLASIYTLLVRRPELLEEVKAVPELEGLTSLVTESEELRK
jgi:hypothetical protein